MLWVSFSPAPEYVEADCWNRAFLTPPRAQERGYRSSFVPLLSYLVAARFLKADYHYTTIIYVCVYICMVMVMVWGFYIFFEENMENPQKYNNFVYIWICSGACGRIEGHSLCIF